MTVAIVVMAVSIVTVSMMVMRGGSRSSGSTTETAGRAATKTARRSTTKTTGRSTVEPGATTAETAAPAHLRLG